MTPDQLAATIAAQDARLAATRTPRKRLPNSHNRPCQRSLDVVYDLVTGRARKMPERPAVEKRLRSASKALRSGAYAEALGLSRALDQAELVGMGPDHPLVERCADQLAAWERAQ